MSTTITLTSTKAKKLAAALNRRDPREQLTWAEVQGMANRFHCTIETVRVRAEEQGFRIFGEAPQAPSPRKSPATIPEATLRALETATSYKLLTPEPEADAPVVVPYGIWKKEREVIRALVRAYRRGQSGETPDRP